MSIKKGFYKEGKKAVINALAASETTPRSALCVAHRHPVTKSSYCIVKKAQRNFLCNILCNESASDLVYILTATAAPVWTHTPVLDMNVGEF